MKEFETKMITIDKAIESLNGFKIKRNSRQLANLLDVPHKELMRFYWGIENEIVGRRDLIRCTLVLDDDGENWLNDMSDTLLFACAIKFDKVSELDSAFFKEWIEEGHL